ARQHLGPLLARCERQQAGVLDAQAAHRARPVRGDHRLRVGEEVLRQPHLHPAGAEPRAHLHLHRVARQGCAARHEQVLVLTPPPPGTRARAAGARAVPRARRPSPLPGSGFRLPPRKPYPTSRPALSTPTIRRQRSSNGTAKPPPTSLPTNGASAAVIPTSSP